MNKEMQETIVRVNAEKLRELEKAILTNQAEISKVNSLKEEEVDNANQRMREELEQI
jgi:hypothetical protein